MFLMFKLDDKLGNFQVLLRFSSNVPDEGLFRCNEMSLHDTNRNSENDILMLLPIKVVMMSYCESLPLPLPQNKTFFFPKKN